MAWPSTKSSGDTISASDWNNIVNFACRKDQGNTQTAGSYNLSGGPETGYLDTGPNGMVFASANCRIRSENTLRLLIDSDADSSDQKLEVLKDTSGATGGTTLFEVREDGSLYAPSLPTSDPSEAGVLWSNSGVVTVSAG